MALPQGWALTKWDNTVSITHGKEKINIEIADGKYPIYGSSGIIGRSNEYLCPAGSIIIGRKGTINNPLLTTENFWNIDTAFGVTPTEAIASKFLYYFCLQFNFKILDRSTTIPSLTQSNLYDISIPLPPLPEQHRIVAKIDSLFSELDSGVTALQTIKTQITVYRQAVLLEAFRRVLETNKKMPLFSIVEGIFDGPFGSNLKTSDYTHCGVRVIRLENIKSMRFNDKKETFISEEKYEKLKGNTVSFPDIIISTFITDEIKSCIIPSHIEYAVNKADCVCIRTNAELFSKFLVYYLSSKQVYNSLFQQVHGATRPRINTTQIKRIPVPYCPKDEQLAIVSAIESRLSMCDKLEQTIDQTLALSVSLRQSILKKAFEGWLVPQDPNDEPAEKLLERIKAERETVQKQKITIRRSRKYAKS
ncbi:restriction endonuclease type I, S subunit [Spirochaetia bacterium]|nr:restriction endonuclease type I, S subunit [Spirochaetia bacterium]